MLGRTRMTIEQIATRFGYTESASFIRAFRRWGGCPPREFRSRGGHSGQPLERASVLARAVRGR
ncbi:helix-turn-helix domain-containing protein [Nocardia sp. NPDC050793]|uniref:helix-turn-helix domain-containing protein n=1 Tax=Nocardia sp. NPDC050793 TaxID=3155159 RepID=UPI0033C5297E